MRLSTSTSLKDYRKEKNIHNFYDWLIYDTEEVIGTLMLISRVGLFLLYGVILTLNIYYTQSLGFISFIISCFFAWSAYKLLKFFMNGGRNACKGMCLNDFIKK